ncbi:L-2-hydroxyglutarate oxidase [Verrucomicrobia bacterium LW23]|nr:L-2-hydroxyglutarate oxidase [Verrucomicrobia bacterium LW23]
MKSCVIVGGGLVGLAIAAKLLHVVPGLKLTLLEKEQALGKHQSTHNSGVLHAGLYYKPGSVKARMAVSGIKQMTAFCQKYEIAHEICGKIVVAVSDEEIPRLRTLIERGTANGLQGLAWLERDQIVAREPHVAGKAAVLVPEEGIVDYAGVCEALRQRILERGGAISLGFNVLRLTRLEKGWRVESAGQSVEAEFLVNCAGLQCDRIGRLAGVKDGSQIVPFRGDYYKLRPEREGLVRHLIYPVPDPAFPFLGVHFTRMIHGGVEAGPNAVLALKREGYGRLDFAAGDALETLLFPGLWRFAVKHGVMCGQEVARAMSKNLFCRSLQRLVPDVVKEDLVPGGAGVRAQAMTRDGTLVQDFEIQQDKQSLHVLNAPSPGATASLAIADELLTRLGLSTCTL